MTIKTCRMKEIPCNLEKGKVIEKWQTGDTECNAYSERYECGGVYNNNYMDIVGCRDHDCFWNCEHCKYEEEQA